MGMSEVVVWYEGGACTVFDAPAMSLKDGFVHEDNNIDWSDPDDGIYWERACVCMLAAEDGEPRARPPRVVDSGSGSVIAEFEDEQRAEEYASFLAAQGTRCSVLSEPEAAPPSSESRVFHRRTCLITGGELASAISVEVRGVLVLVRSSASKNECGLLDVTAQSLGYPLMWGEAGRTVSETSGEPSKQKIN